MEQRFASFKLPPGRHGLSQDQVAENQRWRLLGAAVELLAEAGYRALTARGIATRAAVSSQAFYVHFDNVADCLRAAFAVGARNLETSVYQGCDSAVDREERIAGAVGASFEMLACEPALRRLFGPETRAAVPALSGLYSQLIAPLAAALQQEDRRSEDHSPIRCRLIVQAALQLASEAGTPELREPSPLADQLATLISCLISGAP